MNADPRPQERPQEERPHEDEIARAPARRGAAILPFAEAVARRVRRPAKPAHATGEILLFTGVRYERLNSDDTDPEECAVAARPR